LRIGSEDFWLMVRIPLALPKRIFLYQNIETFFELDVIQQDKKI
jgi:hypothetical protein